MESTHTLQLGSLLFNGHYRIVGILGRGGFGITYLAVVENLGKQVAIKEFFPQGMYSRDSLSGYVSISNSDNDVLGARLKAKFIKEARRLASLKHESIIAVSNAFEENGTAYYVMDFIAGRDLLSIVNESGPLPVDRAMRYIRQVGSALEYLHYHKINHLDVKPANILVDTDTDHAVLIDFGLSKQYDSADRQTSTTPVGLSVGYAPVEQYEPDGVLNFSAPTDIYSLGATLYYMLVGQRPPSASMLSQEGLVFPDAVPAYIRDAICRAMAYRRADRYPTVADFLAALTPGATTPVATDTDAVEIKVDMPKQPSRKWLKILLIVIALVAVVAIVYFVVLRGGGDTSPAHDSDSVKSAPVVSPLHNDNTVEKVEEPKDEEEQLLTVDFDEENRLAEEKEAEEVKKAEDERLAKEKAAEEARMAEEERIANEKAAEERIAKKKAEEEQLAKERAEMEAAPLRNAIHPTPRNMDLCVAWDGRSGYISEADWKMLSDTDKRKVTKKGLYVHGYDNKGSYFRFIIDLYDLNNGKLVSWDDAKQQSYFSRLPSKEQAEVISKNSDAINAALKAYGGRVMEGFYWTKNVFEKNSSFAWSLDMQNGYLCGNFRTSTYKVRAILP